MTDPQPGPEVTAGLVAINPNALISGLTSNSMRLRDVCFAIRHYASSLSKYSDQQLTTVGFSSDEIVQMRQLSGYMDTVAQVFLGKATQTTPKDYYDALSVLWNGA